MFDKRGHFGYTPSTKKQVFTKGSVIGFVMGVLPGIGGIIPTFVTYSLERKFSKHPERFGTGADVLVLVIFGILGYLMRKLRFDAPPFILVLILGQMLEISVRQSLVMSQGSFWIFVQRPIELAFFCVSAVFFFSPLIAFFSRGIKALRKESEFDG